MNIPEHINNDDFWKELESKQPKNKFSIERHGDGYAIYLGRNMTHHGMNIAHLTEVTENMARMLEDFLNGFNPQRTWVGLTDEEIYEATKDVDKKPLRVIVDLLEAKLKEKNK